MCANLNAHLFDNSQQSTPTVVHGRIIADALVMILGPTSSRLRSVHSASRHERSPNSLSYSGHRRQVHEVSEARASAWVSTYSRTFVNLPS